MACRRCPRIVAFSLYPLVCMSIICNILLFFPGWDTKYIKEGHITPEVKHMGGLVGGGFMVLLSALYISLTAEEQCCGYTRRMCLSVIFAAVGFAGATYSCAMALNGLKNGPYCKVGSEWLMPFEDRKWKYLSENESMEKCSEPAKVVQFNTTLFLILVTINCVQMLLCASQMIIGCFNSMCSIWDKSSAD